MQCIISVLYMKDSSFVYKTKCNSIFCMPCKFWESIKNNNIIIILDIKNRKIKFENHELKSCVGLFNYRHVTFKLLWIGIPCQENLFRNSVLIISETHRSEFVCIVNGYTTYL